MIDISFDPPDRNPGKSFRWILIDSTIISLITFISSLPLHQFPTVLDIYRASISSLYAFLYSLAIQSGVENYKKRKRRKGLKHD
ncbi:MAG: hypothetical protein QXD57_07075 [Ignisphaera sp.]